MSLRGAGFRWSFGSLANGTAAPALRPDQLAEARNVEHDLQGSISKRPGYRHRWGVAPAPENSVAPVLSNLGATSGSTLGNGTLYARVTFSTVPGETDDLHSTQGSIVSVAGNGYRVWFPFHVFAQQVLLHEQSDNTLRLNSAFTSSWLTAMADDTFNGWYVYCRDPSVQDEVKLGINPQNRKLWDRTNFIAKILDWDQSDGLFTLDRSLPLSLTGKTIDILMPDRAGCPIRAANLYVSSNGTDFYRYGSYSPLLGASEGHPSYFDVTSIPTSNKRAPSTRITRTAPTVAATDVTDTNPQTGIVSTAATGLKGGLYSIRYAFETADPQWLDNGGWPEHSDFRLMKRPRLSTQKAWPSKRALVGISEDQGIAVTLPTFPAGCPIAHVYARRLTPAATLTFSGVTYPSSTHRAFHLPGGGSGLNPWDNTYSVSTATATLALTPAQFVTLAGTDGDEYRNTGLAVSTTPRRIKVANYTAITTVDGPSAADTEQDGFARLPYRDVSNPSHPSPLVKHQFEFQLTAPQQSSTTFACLVLRLKPFKSLGFLTEAASQPSVYASIGVRRWDATDAWVALDSWKEGDALQTRRYCVAFDAADLVSNRLCFDVYGLQGLHPYIDYAALELYTDTSADIQATTSDVWQASSRETTLTLDTALCPASTGDAIHVNTSGQWSVAQHANFVQNFQGGPETIVQNLVGCADSVFLVKADNTLDRVYQHDREDGCTSLGTLMVSQYDWQFASYLSRTFFVNEGNDLPYNLRFDGVQTHGWGLDTPNVDAKVLTDDGRPPTDGEPPPSDDPWGCARFKVTEQWHPVGTTSQAWSAGNSMGGAPGRENVDASKHERWTVKDPEGGSHRIFDYRYLNSAEQDRTVARGTYGYIGTVFEGVWFSADIRRVTGTYTEDIIHCLLGDTPPEPPVEEPVPEGLPEGDFDYYVVDIRDFSGDGLDGRGYIVRSAPVQAATVNVSGDVKITLKIGPPTDPQVTHRALYRNLRLTADWFLLGVPVEVSQEQIGPDGYMAWEDSTTDEALAAGSLANFRTGRPAPASRVAAHKNRMWFVPLFNKSAVGFTNIAFAEDSGDVDPEGWYSQNTIVPTMQKQGPITALVGTNDTLTAHSNSGLAQINGVSDDMNSTDPISSVGLFAEAGAIGPQAWCEAEGVLFFMSRLGPAVMGGQTVTYLGDLVEGTIGEINFSDVAARYMRCVYRRTSGVSQVWFTYSDRKDSRPDKALVFNTPGAASEDSRRLWTRWTELDAHSVVRTKLPTGEERIFLGDRFGRVHEFGALRSDNGRFIDAEVTTAPLQMAGAARSFTPRRLILIGRGRTGDFVHLDILKDLGGDPRNIRKIRIPFTGTGSSRWGTAGSTWGAAGSPGTWGGGSGTGYSAHGVHMGGTFHHLQLHFQQLAADMPPGTRRDAQIELAGFDMTFREAGFRRRDP